MRNISINLQNNRILPGQILEGIVTIKTEKSFDCNRVVMKIRGKEHTEFGAGEDRVSDDKTILGKVFRIREGGTIPEGTTRIPFSFQLPKRLPPTYKGDHGYIEYDAEAVVEVDWAIDPKDKTLFKVLQNRPQIVDDTNQLEPSTLSDNELQIELEEDVLRLSSGIKVRFRVKERSRVRGVRCEIIRHEAALCCGRDLDHDTTMVRKFYEIGYNDFDRWLEMDIGENWRYHLPLESMLFTVTYYLKVTLDIGLDFDPSIKYPIKFSDDVPEKDVLDEIAIDLGFDEW